MRYAIDLNKNNNKIEKLQLRIIQPPAFKMMNNVVAEFCWKIFRAPLLPLGLDICLSDGDCGVLGHD